jgi:hypothetical protein
MAAVYTQVGIDFVAALSPPKSPFLGCPKGYILGDFELASEIFLPQNSDFAGKKGGRGAVCQDLADVRYNR